MNFLESLTYRAVLATIKWRIDSSLKEQNMTNILGIVQAIFSILTSMPAIIAKVEKLYEDPATQSLVSDVEAEFKAVKAAISKL